MAHYIWHYSVSGLCTPSCSQKKNRSQKMICPHSCMKGWQSMSNRKSRLIDREANEAYASGPLTCMGPFQDSGRGSSNALKSYSSYM